MTRTRGWPLTLVLAVSPACSCGDGDTTDADGGADASATLDGGVGLDGTIVLPDGRVITPTDGGGVCDPVGTPCTTGAQCCTGACETTPSGLACISATSCAPLGEACSVAADCCSLGCSGAACPFGELCRSDAECCNSEVADMVCEPIAGSGGLGRCGNPGGCAPAGEICGVGGDPSGTNECCPGNPDGRELCRPAVAGVDRCQGEGARDTCLADGATCATPDECCSGVCTDADGDGVLTCSETCVAEGGSCTRSADCCAGNCRLDGTCGPPEVSCLPLGAACTDSAECCSAWCDPATMQCSVDLR